MLPSGKGGKPEEGGIEPGKALPASFVQRE